MRKALFFFLSLLAGTLLFFWVIKVIGLRDIKRIFLGFSPWQGIIILALTIINLFIENWKWREILVGQGVVLPQKQLLKIYLAGYSIKYLFPMAMMGGEMVKGYFLKNLFSIPWLKGLSSVLIDRILTWTINILAICVGVSFFLLKISFPAKALAIVMAVVFFGFIFGIAFFYFRSMKRQSIANIFFKLIKVADKEAVLAAEDDIFTFFRARNKALWRCVAISFVRVAVLVLRAWLLVFFLGGRIGVLPALSLLSFALLIHMIPIPASIGSHEAVQFFTFTALGLGAASAAAFTMILRATEVIAALIGIGLLFRLGIGSLKNIILRKTETLISS